MGRRAGVAALAVALTIVLFAGSASAAPGDLDPTFDGDGIATAPGAGLWVRGVHVQPSGRIVVIARDGGDAVASAFTPTGGIDTAFGAGGTSSIDGMDVWNSSMFPDGRIAVVGFGAEVMRLSVNGEPDPGFGTGGIAPLPPWLETYDVAALAMGGVVVVGVDVRTCNRFGDHCMGALARLKPDGSVAWAKTLDMRTSAPSVAIGPLDRIVVSASFGVYAYLGVNGLPDLTFGILGRGNLPEQPVRDVAVDGRGRVVVAVGRHRIARLAVTGLLDRTFGTKGVTQPVHDQGFTVDFISFALLADETIAVVGDRCTGLDPIHVCASTYGIVVRFLPNGQLDTAFAAGGVLRSPIQFSDVGVALAGQPDSKIVLAAHQSTNVQVARFLQ